MGPFGQLVNNSPEVVKSRLKGVMGTLMAVVAPGEESRLITLLVVSIATGQMPLGDKLVLGVMLNMEDLESYTWMGNRPLSKTCALTTKD